MTENRMKKIISQMNHTRLKSGCGWNDFVMDMTFREVCDIELYKAIDAHAAFENDPIQAVSDFWRQYCALYRAVRKRKSGMFMVKAVREMLLSPEHMADPERNLKDFVYFLYTARQILSAADKPRRQKKQILQNVLFLFTQETGETACSDGYFPRYLASYLETHRSRSEILALWSHEPKNVQYMLRAYCTLPGFHTDAVREFLEEYMAHYTCGQIPYLEELYLRQPKIHWCRFITPDVPPIPIQRISQRISHMRKGQEEKEAREILREWNGFTVPMDLLCQRLMIKTPLPPYGIYKMFTAFRKAHQNLHPAELEYCFLQMVLQKLES